MSSPSDGMEKGDRKVIIISALFVLLCLLLFYFADDIFRSMGSNSERVGAISEIKNEGRLKLNGTLEFSPARAKDEVHVGDSFICGDGCSATIDMKKGQQMTVGEKSLVVFRSINNAKFADLQYGSFRVSVDGETKLAIHGQMVVLNGKDADVQLVLTAGEKPKIRVLKGTLKPTEGLAGPALSETTKGNLTGELNVAPLGAEAPKDLQHLERTTYHWKLHDLYEDKEGRLTRKPAAMTETVPLSVPLHWANPQKKAAIVSLSRNGDFADAQNQNVAADGAALSRVYLGANFWRASYDGSHWSGTEHFDVQAESLSVGIPEASFSREAFTLANPSSSVTVDLKSPIDPTGFIGEKSTDENFPDGEQTETFWFPKSHFDLSFTEAGVFHFRFRAVDKNQELTEWSQPKTIQVFPALKVVPIVRQPPKPPRLKFEPPEPPPIRKLAQQPKPVPTPASQKQERKPADVVQTAKAPPPPPTYPNSNYSHSYLSLEGFLWTLQSTQQIIHAEDAPVATGIGLRGLHWWDHSGVEGILKSQVFGMNPPAKDTSYKDVEARYHYRFFSGFPFNWARELLVSIFGGTEIYRSSGQLFSPAYNLVTMGTLIEFPVARHWGLGGEFVFGEGLDSSHKYEITGHMRYYFSPKYSVSFGYLLHLFEAGSPSSAALGILPFREGYTEGYSTLDYHF